MVELSDDFKLSYDDLDKEHQKLVAMVNEINGTLDAGKTDNCKDRVLAFINFAKGHFAREERLLAKSGYPDAEKHRKHHKKLDQKMEHILEFAEMVAVNEMARESLKKELVFFLMDDVITTDLEFKAFLESKLG